MYMSPEIQADAIILCRRLTMERDIRYHSPLGGVYLLFPPSRKSIAPSVLIATLVALFALGHLSRYYAATWNQAMRLDPHNERGLVERFISVVGRLIPTETLSRIIGERVIFAPPVVNSDRTISDERLRRLIREHLDEGK
jgi:hypothetical protein